MWYTLLTFLSLLLFLSAEKSFVHFSRTARRVFWYALSCSLGLSLVRALQTVEGMSMSWVFLSAVLAASVVEDEVRKKVGLTQLDIEASRRLLADYHTPEARGKAERLMDIVGAINKGRGYTAGTKQLLLQLSGTRKRLQAALHSVLETAQPTELNYILCAINAPAMVEIAARHTIELLVRDRVEDLTTVARAVLVDALQKLGLRYRPQRQRWAAAVVLRMHGRELTHLKAYLDDGGDYHTMYKLAYQDLQGEAQAAVLEHLSREGRALAAECQLAHPCCAGAVLKVLSDVDDTLFSSGGAFPAGSDARYPRKCFYPGALALYAELDRCFAQRHAAALASARAGVPPMTPRPQLSRPSPSRPPHFSRGVYELYHSVSEVGQHDAAAADAAAAHAAAGPEAGAAGAGPGAAGEGAREGEGAPASDRACSSSAAEGAESGGSSPTAAESWRTGSGTATPTGGAAGAAGAAAGGEDESGAESAGESQVQAERGEHAEQAQQAPVSPVLENGTGEGPQQSTSQVEGAAGTASSAGAAGTEAQELQSPFEAALPQQGSWGQAAASSSGEGAEGGGSGGLGVQAAAAAAEAVVGAGGASPPVPIPQHHPQLQLQSKRALSGHLAGFAGTPPRDRALGFSPPAGGSGGGGSMPRRAAAPQAPPLRGGQPPPCVPGGFAAFAGSCSGRGPGSLGWQLSLGSGVPTLHAPVSQLQGQLHQEGSNLVFLSARPESYKGMTESEAYKKYFQPMVAGGLMSTAPTMLLGSLGAGPRAIAKYLLGWRPPTDNPATAASALYQTLAAKKLSRFREYAAIYPEAAFVFIGDNGQGDVLCAEILWSTLRPAGAAAAAGAEHGAAAAAGSGHQLAAAGVAGTAGAAAAAVAAGDGSAGGAGCESSHSRSRLLGCLIHKVVPLGSTYSMLRSSKGDKAAWREQWRQRDIFFNSTHVGMALQALSLGLIDQEALHRVAASAVADFRRIFARYSGRRSGQRLGKALKQLNKDIVAANSCLPHHLQVAPLVLGSGGGSTALVGGEAGLAGGESSLSQRRPLSPARSEAWSELSFSTSVA